MKVYYVLGTHWDREWYEPFQEFRFWLVQNLDAILDRMKADSRLAVYHLDGQAVLLEDYLEIRPDRREELTGLLRQGRLIAGPWYAQPDLWLVSGESLIRNLLRGMRVVRELGSEPARIGYAPDLFGHIAAMPMIYTGFGFIGAVVWRGLNDDQTKAQFLWEGPDGSRIPTHKLPDHAGYPWYGHRVRWPWTNAGFDPVVLIEKVKTALEDEGQRSAVPIYYFSDTGDHQGLPLRIPEMLDILRDAFPDIEFVMDPLTGYFEELGRQASLLKPFSGELRYPARQTGTPWHALIPHCLSSRYPIKKANDRCQSLLTYWAEPLAAFSLAVGKRIPSGFLDQAWKHLLQNHAHDSICGCSVDATHEDMPYRFRQAEHLADAVVRQGMAHLTRVSAAPEAVRYVTVWNPLPWVRSEVVELDLFFPADSPSRAMRSGHGLPLLNQFELCDPDGRALPYQILSVSPSHTIKQPDELGRRRKVDGKLDVYRVAIYADLPPCGYTGFSVRPLEGTGKIRRPLASLRTEPLAAANEHLAVSLSPDGTATIKHLATGRVFRDLFLYEDSGDTGDGWNYVPPMHNPTGVTPGQIVATGVEEDGPLQVTFRIERILRVPAGLEPVHREKRLSETVEMPITDFLTLKKGDPRLHVRTVIENRTRDHRLRVLFPSDIRADTYESDQPFAWVSRAVAIDPRSAEYKEADPIERPHHSVFAIGDSCDGLAVLCPEGLHEHSVYDDSRRTLALTLFRGVHRTPTTDGEPGAQVLGTMEFRYALRPFAGPLPHALLLRETMALQAGARSHLAGEPVGRRSFFRLEGSDDILVTSVKPGEDGGSVVVRLWNTAFEEREAVLQFEPPPKEAMRCNLAEETQGSLPVFADGVSVKVCARGLATVKLVFGAGRA